MVPAAEDEVSSMIELVRERSVVCHELFQEAMGAMNCLGEELAGVDSRLEAEGLRLVEEWRKLRVAINLGRYHRDLENAKAEASLRLPMRPARELWRKLTRPIAAAKSSRRITASMELLPKLSLNP